MRFAHLRRELAARGIRGRLAARIELELADHLACDPDANLGDPAEIAERFAAELRGVRTRRASAGTFVALAMTALVLFVLGRNGANSGDSPIAGLGVFCFSQIAFVAGTLALWRALRGRTAGDFRLAQRRALVALASGVGVSVCLGIAVGPRALLALPMLAVAFVMNRRASVLTPAGPAERLRADLGPHAAFVLAALGVVAVAGVVFQGAVFEGSGWEGIIRGATEAGGLLIGVTVLGRPLALRA